MATGSFDSWAGNINEIGVLYPFEGTEFLLFIIGLVAWIAWHVIQAKRETRLYEEEIRRFGNPESLERMLNTEKRHLE